MGLEYDNQGFLLHPPPCHWQTGASQWESQHSPSSCSVPSNSCFLPGGKGLALPGAVRISLWATSALFFFVLSWALPINQSCIIPSNVQGHFWIPQVEERMSHFFQHVKCTSYGSNLPKLCWRLVIVEESEGSQVWRVWDFLVDSTIC